MIPQYTEINVSVSGPSTIVPAVSGQRIFIIHYRLDSNNTLDVNFQSHLTTTNRTGLHHLSKALPADSGYCPVGLFVTSVGEALDLNIASTAQAELQSDAGEQTPLINVAGQMTYAISAGWPTI